MSQKRICILYFLIFLLCTSCNQALENQTEQSFEVAFMPDVHFHDIFAEFDDNSFTGLETVAGSDTLFATIRTLESQLRSTRLFNENYFAFLAALDMAVERGIKLIALPGDFSDDGQPVHIRGLKSILKEYQQKHDVRFFLAPGNHDPNRPINQPAGKRDYLGPGGREQPIFSHNHSACTEEYTIPSTDKQPHPVICTDEVMEYGYSPILNELAEFGFQPTAEDRYFETPYSKYSYSDYSDELGANAAKFENRQYEICHQGTGGRYKEATYTHCSQVGDLSYLIEPAEGLWLLSIDANVYLPRQLNVPFDPQNPNHLNGSGNAGYNRLLTHKEHIPEWIKDVTNRADSLNKQLVAFSHFPMAEFYDDSFNLITKLFGEDGSLQQRRMPLQGTAEALAQTGLRLHIGGHMHMNDTGIITDRKSGHTLFNIQAPSIAAYQPAFKIVTLHATGSSAEVETIMIDHVPKFQTLFPHYQQEWSYLNSIKYEDIWNRDILDSKTYLEFTNWHIRELARLRFFAEHWPTELHDNFLNLNGREIAAYILLTNRNGFEPDEFNIPESEIHIANALLEESGFKPDDFLWTGSDVVLDFHRLLSAGELAYQDITRERMSQYLFLDDLASGPENPESHLELVFQIMEHFINEVPSTHIQLNLMTGEIKDLNHPK
jgi:3',5'-cyclic AMP phosphodiesterase CpdA